MASYSIAGKVVLVTGANRGIGKAIVEGFTKARAGKIYAGVRRVETAPSGTVPLRIDLNGEDSIAQASEIAQDVQVIVNSGGILDVAPPLSADAVLVMQKQMETNVYGMMHMARYFMPILERNTNGCFVQINSASSMRCKGDQFGGYAASKAASYMYTQSLRASTSTTRILSVHPGPIATDMVNQYGAAEAEDASQVGTTSATVGL